MEEDDERKAKMAQLKLIKTQIVTNNKDTRNNHQGTHQGNHQGNHHSPDSISVHSAASSVTPSVCSETVSVEETPSISLSVSANNASSHLLLEYGSSLSVTKMIRSDKEDDVVEEKEMITMDIVPDKELPETTTNLKAEAVSVASNVSSTVNSPRSQGNTHSGGYHRDYNQQRKRKQNERERRRQRNKLKRFRKKTVSFAIDFFIFPFFCVFF